MAKLTKKFAFATPLIVANRLPVELRISGIGYYLPAFTTESKFDYDLESVTADGKEIPLSLVRYLVKEGSSSFANVIHHGTISHLEWLFLHDGVDVDTTLDQHLEYPTAEELKTAHEKVTAGDFSDDNLFKAFGHIARTHAEHLLNGFGII